ncbi:MAG: GDP-L-fucose synthase [Beijerinckiaceae bacterium]|nr:GDP-L-fucose synthase [Beijerinckiaceae bacterium]
MSGKTIWVAGHRGMAGSAIVRRLQSENCRVLTADRSELDLLSQAATAEWMRSNAPDVVVIAAAKVGGIHANNTYPADFLYNNLMIETNIIKTAHDIGVEKLLFLGSSCIYPKFAEQPMTESALLTGALEPTNEWYALAKIAGLKLCEAYRKQYGDDFITAMPTNLYGPGDNFDLANSHVLPALLRKAHDGKVNSSPSIELWGSGTPMREFLHVDDLADACIFLLKTYSESEHVNVGAGREISIKGLATLIAEIVGFEGGFTFDASKQDGSPRKLLDTSKLSSRGWTARIELRDGIQSTYRWFQDNLEMARL